MAVAIAKITDGRGRADDTIVIDGTGFSATNNAVTVGGVGAAITAQGTTQITATVPTGIAVDQFVQVRVTNLDDATFDELEFWSKDTVTSLAVVSLPIQLPGDDEIAAGPTVEFARNAEAKDYERLLTLVEELRASRAVSFSVFEATDEPFPAAGLIGDFKSEDFSASVDNEVKVQWHVQPLFPPSARLRAKFAMSTADVGTVRISTEGSIDNVTAIAASELTVDPLDTANTFETQLLRTVTGLTPGDELLLKVKRVATDAVNDTHGGLWRLLELILEPVVP